MRKVAIVVSESSASQLVSQVERFRDGAWDPAVLRRTELCLIDSLSCYSAGRSLGHFEPSLAVARRLVGANPSASRSTYAFSPFAMAYLYGQASNALDYDDTLYGHPGAPIVGAVMAVGARDSLSIDHLLRGIAAGYEAHTILGAASAPSNERAAQVRSVGAWDTVAASLAVGVALGLSASMLERVIGVAVAHSLLPYTAKWYERPVPAMKNNLGWAAAGAVLSTDLATAGQSGVTRALDGDAGMWQMVGSDRWDLDSALGQTAAVLRVGFKHFPVCWHLQEYLKVFSHLIKPIPQDDEVIEIVLAGPDEVEKFCEPTIFDTADVAFSLPAAFSLLLSGVEPGPRWDSVHETSPSLRYREVFRYERAGLRSLAIRTRDGFESSAVVEVSDPTDLAASGLDEQGVLAKHQRLADPVLHGEVSSALPSRNPAAKGKVPEKLYRLVHQMMADQAAKLEAGRS